MIANAFIFQEIHKTDFNWNALFLILGKNSKTLMSPEVIIIVATELLKNIKLYFEVGRINALSNMVR